MWSGILNPCIKHSIWNAQGARCHIITKIPNKSNSLSEMPLTKQALKFQSQNAIQLKRKMNFSRFPSLLDLLNTKKGTTLNIDHDAFGQKQINPMIDMGTVKCGVLISNKLLLPVLEQQLPVNLQLHPLPHDRPRLPKKHSSHQFGSLFLQSLWA